MEKLSRVEVHDCSLHDELKAVTNHLAIDLTHRLGLSHHTRKMKPSSGRAIDNGGESSHSRTLENLDAAASLGRGRRQSCTRP